MKATTHLVWAAVAAVAVGARAASYNDAAPAVAWVPAYTSDFANAHATTDAWLSVAGDIALADGRLVLRPGKRKNALAVLDALSFPASVRVEAVGSVAAAEKPEYLSFNISLGSDGAEMTSGYLLQFGARGNTCSLLKKGDAVVAATINKEIRPEAGKSYRIVAEKLDHRISLWVDDAQVFSYTDLEPLDNPTRGALGLFTWACSLTLEKVTVYTRKDHPEDIVTPMAAPADSPEVTLRGILMWNEASMPYAPTVEHGQVLYALTGTPEVSAAWEQIVRDFWPGDSLDGEQALRFNREVERQLKIYLAPGQKAMRAQKGEGQWRSPPMAVTGRLVTKDGRRWIVPSRMALDKNFRKTVYPAKMLAPDKPFATPGKEPLTLKVTDTLSLKCILLPAGKFVMGNPFYCDPRWQDEFPHLVTLTRPFYLAEIPVTQEMWESVMTNNPGTVKDPQRPVRNAACAEINKFCRILSERNGRKVRLPTEAEWEYAARVGTSNPPLVEKYTGQDSRGAGPRKPLLPVKSKPPNAWGLHDMLSDVWELTRDKFVFHRVDEVDPYYSCEDDESAGRNHAHWGKGCVGEFLVSNHENVGMGAAKDDADYVTTKFRVMVEATPAEIAEMEETAKK